MKGKWIVLLLPVLLMACAKPNSSNLEEKRNREVEVDNENLRRKAETLEADLERRQRFFSALEGEFEGTFNINDKEFMTRLTFVPSLPPYQSGRTRTLEEITADLNNLYFTVQATHWNTATNAVAAGCVFSEVKPDYDGGKVNAAAADCSNIYAIHFYNSEGSSGDLPFEKPGIPQKSKDMAEKVLEKRLARVDEIFVIMKPTMTEKTFLMVLRRVEQQ